MAPPPPPAFPQAPAFPSAPGFAGHSAAYNSAFTSGLLFGALTVGILCGLLPLLVARSRGRASMGIAGLVVCAIAGLFGGLILAVPAAVLVTLVAVIVPPADRF